MKEDKRRRIAREFLEENFGTYGVLNIEACGMKFNLPKPFELFRAWDSMKVGVRENEARAFEVMYSPYHSNAKKRVIAVSDDEEELMEVVNQCFEKNDVKYADYKGHKVAYD